MKNARSKIASNLLLSVISASVVSVLIPGVSIIAKLVVGFVVLSLLFVLATFFGDEPFNVTGLWSKKAKKVKNIFGHVFFWPLMMLAMVICIVLIYLLATS